MDTKTKLTNKVTSELTSDNSSIGKGICSKSNNKIYRLANLGGDKCVSSLKSQSLLVKQEQLFQYVTVITTLQGMYSTP